MSYSWALNRLFTLTALVGLAVVATAGAASSPGCLPNADARCNVIEGYAGNTVSGQVVGATISGGGGSTIANHVVADFGTVGGGLDNKAGDRATVSGGSDNTASGYRSTIGGESSNSATSAYATIAGGTNNTARYIQTSIGGGIDNTASSLDATIAGGSGNVANWDLATVGGGSYNTASSLDATVAGGATNTASGAYSTLGGGSTNRASGFDTAIGGGSGNTASGDSSLVAGGLANRATSNYTTVGGGSENQAGDASDDPRHAEYATVSGGLRNTASGWSSMVGGGTDNAVSGSYSTIPGCSSNRAAGAYSLASGRRAIIAQGHDGSFLFADSTDAEFDSIAANEFAVRAIGGVRFVKAVDGAGGPAAGVWLASGSGSWESLSDRNAKSNLAPVETSAILAEVAAMPISTWNYTTEDASVRHMGPMAQDFSRLGLGRDDKHIANVDAKGAALAAIQGLYQVVEDKDRRITAQDQEIADLKRQVAQQQTEISTAKAGLANLEQRMGLSGASSTWPVDPSAFTAVLACACLAGLVLGRMRSSIG